LFKMLRQADLLTTNNIINSSILSPRLIESISSKNREDTLMFPSFEFERNNREL